ncbi:MAG TPA: DUF2071 domain-containing protein [Polyangiales bacterium]|nr:DUF2071 domain-containing protein [Polyangiales bacterium]
MSFSHSWVRRKPWFSRAWYNAAMDRIAPTRRPDRPVQGQQRWHQLLFSHWVVPEAVLRPLVPARLTLDTFQGACYAGVVAFVMQNVRPFLWAPSIPTATTFGEVNLRTYVHLDGREPGVFFFSLDAESSLAVWAARTLWSLPYFYSRVSVQEAGAEMRYRVERRTPRVAWSAQAQLGAALAAPEPDSLEFFLCERYQFYAERRGQLLRARVSHAPYALRAATCTAIDGSLLTAAGLPDTGARTRDLWSPGVDVEVFALERA